MQMLLIWASQDICKCIFSTLCTLQAVVSEVTDAHNRELLFEANEDFIIKVQALVRRYLARKAYRNRLAYLEEQEPSVVKVQVSLGTSYELVETLAGYFCIVGFVVLM